MPKNNEDDYMGICVEEDGYWVMKKDKRVEICSHMVSERHHLFLRYCLYLKYD